MLIQQGSGRSELLLLLLLLLSRFSHVPLCATPETAAHQAPPLRGLKNINLRCEDNTTLMAESEEELKSLLMRVKEEGKKKLV